MTQESGRQADMGAFARAAVIEAKAGELARAIARIGNFAYAGEMEAARKALPAVSAAFQSINFHLVLLRHALGVGAAEHIEGLRRVSAETGRHRPGGPA